MDRTHSLNSEALIKSSFNLKDNGKLNDTEVIAALQYMVGHLDTNLTVQGIADERNISRRTLELQFRKHLNYTVSEALTKLRLAAARELLCRTELPVSDISVDVGFSSPSRLCHALKRILGVTATQIRNESAIGSDCSGKER